MADRDARGRLLPGHAKVPNSGRGPKAKETHFWDILVKTVTNEDWKEIVRKAVAQAKEGDQAARKWLSDYIMGTPLPRKDVSETVNAPQFIEVLTDEPS